MNVLVDTSVIIDVLRGRDGRPALLERLLTRGALLCSSDITLAETWAGAREHEMERTGDLLDSLYYLQSDSGVAKQAGSIRREWLRKGVTLTLADAFLAALCLRHGAILLTDNRRHFPMKHLSVWTPADVPAG